MDYNFLQLVQMAARESGTIPSDLPQTTSGASGRIAKVVHWVNLAWNQIQNKHAYWQWMHGEYSALTAPGIARYSPVQMGISRFGKWVTLPYTLTMYAQDAGKSDESFVPPLEYWRWRRMYDIGVQEPARPSCFAISPGGLLCFGPAPDKEYFVRGEYYKSNQELAADGDIPELPHRFRPMIAWLALVLLSQHDEGGFSTMAAQQKYMEYLGDLEREQLPTVYIMDRAP